MLEIILASKSKVREEILKKNGIQCVVMPSNVDEDPVKESLINEGASPEIISKNLAELKSILISKLIDIIGAEKSEGVINIFKEQVIKKGVKFTEKTLKSIDFIHINSKF